MIALTAEAHRAALWMVEEDVAHLASVIPVLRDDPHAVR
jgi:hypothetical protein